MSDDLEDRLIRIEQKLAHLERHAQQLEAANLDQELRLERMQHLLEADLTTARREPGTEH